MKLVPVIDLLGGEVVRAVGGRRDEYRPIVSQLVASSAPGDVARVFVEKFGVETIYVADLDAIEGRRPNRDAYRSIAAAGVRLWLDAGIGDACGATELRQFLSAAKINADLVLGLESLPSPDNLDDLVARFGAENLLFSLDLRDGRPITAIAEWENLSAEELAADVYRRGIRRMILLDLAAVGVNDGVPTLALAGTLHGRYADLELIGGGGVRGAGDLELLKAGHFSAVLAASALHDVRLP